MALKKYKPVTPSTRQLVLVDRSGLYKGKPVKGLTEGLTSSGGRNNLRPHHGALPGRRSQARLPHRRLQAPQVRRAGDGRAARIRSEPHRLHRAGQVRGRRARPTSWRRSGWPPATRWSPASSADVKPGNAMPLSRDAGRHDRPQCRAEARQGRPDRAFGRRLRAARRPRPGLWRSCASIRASSASCTARAWRPSARCRTRTTATSILGKAGRKRWLGKRPHNRGVAMNPVDHPHGGGEGRTSGGRHPVTPVGQADQGQEDPVQQGDRQIHHALASSAQELTRDSQT